MSEVVSSVIMPHYYAYSTIKAPDKGEVGGSSPPRPTIQIVSEYAAILTFPLFGALSLKTNLPTICQLFEQLNTCAAGLPATIIGSACASPKPERGQNSLEPERVNGLLRL